MRWLNFIIYITLDYITHHSFYLVLVRTTWILGCNLHILTFILFCHAGDLCCMRTILCSKLWLIHKLKMKDVVISVGLWDN